MSVEFAIFIVNEQRMRKFQEGARKSLQRKHWWKWAAGSLAGVLLFLMLTVAAAAWYVETHESEVRDKLLEELNKDLDGNLTIKRVVPELFSGFPRLSLRLEEVGLSDRRISEHQKQLLRADKVEISVNAMALLGGAVEIVRVEIRDASVYLLTDASGYSNTSVFKPRQESGSAEETSRPKLRKFSIENVTFIADNRKRNKLFSYRIDQFKGNIDYDSQGWKAEASLKGFAKSMSFNRVHGSFMENQTLDGRFRARFLKQSKRLELFPESLEIGGEKFKVGATFVFEPADTHFEIGIENPEINWTKASHLLSGNISSRLDLFQMSKPIWVRCDLKGSFESEADPVIIVRAKIRENSLRTPGGVIDHCSFDGLFHNEFEKGKGTTDPNSIIRLDGFQGEYGGVPFSMADFSIRDLTLPIARGRITADFPLPRLNGLVDDHLFKFRGGRARTDVRFEADVANFKLVRPVVKGWVSIEKGEMDYVRRHVKAREVSVDIRFTDKELLIRRLGLSTGKGEMLLQGRVDNFFRLYYSDPKLMVAALRLESRALYLEEILGYVAGSKRSVMKKPKRAGNFTSEVIDLLEQMKVSVDLNVDRLHYRSFTGKQIRAKIRMDHDRLAVSDAHLENSGGRLDLSGSLSRSGSNNRYEVQVSADRVNVNHFFKEFENFGMQSLKEENLSGRFFLRARLSGQLLDNGELKSNTMAGNVAFTLKNGRLRDFEPIRSVGKYAFPNRNLDTISFKELNGAFSLRGNKVDLEPLSVSSSVLNLDLSGVYSFGKGTRLFIDVPLRDPKRDRDITDPEELARRRNRGVVLHLLAEDDQKTGKVKIRLKLSGDKSEKQ